MPAIDADIVTYYATAPAAPCRRQRRRYAFADTARLPLFTLLLPKRYALRCLLPLLRYATLIECRHVITPLLR